VIKVLVYQQAQVCESDADQAASRLRANKRSRKPALQV
jgi:hypothetical protein